MSTRSHPIYLPVPFPRFFTEGKLNESGRIKPQQRDDKPLKDDFVMSIPTLTRLSLDGSYLGEVHQAWSRLRNIRPALKMQLLRDNNFLEEDELKEIVENLSNLSEEYRNITVGLDGEDDDDLPSDNDY